MIEAKELIKLSKKIGILAERLERDYVMSLILDGLSRHPLTKDDIVFKGGCCVHKCFSLFEKPENPKALDPYFTQGRFSSDIDLTISKNLMKTEALMTAFKEVGEDLQKRHGLVLEALDFPMHFNEKQLKTNCRASLHYQGPLYLHCLKEKWEKAKQKGKPFIAPNSPNLKLDLTADERVVYAPTLEKIYHPYFNLPQEQGLQTRCYTLQGMFAEKMRAFMERCSPRDLYDLHVLFGHPDLKSRQLEIGQAIIGKFAFKNIPVSFDEKLLTTPQQDGKSLKQHCRDEWKDSLEQQVGNLGSFDDFWDDKKFPEIIRFAQNCVDVARREENILNAVRQKKMLNGKND